MSTFLISLQHSIMIGIGVVVRVAVVVEGEIKGGTKDIKSKVRGIGWKKGKEKM